MHSTFVKHEKFICIQVQGLPSGAQIIGQHIQQDPTDPSKWQVLQSISATPQPPPLTPGIVTMNTTPNPQLSPDPGHVSGDGGTPKARVRRVACTCPNCSEGER